MLAVLLLLLIAPIHILAQNQVQALGSLFFALRFVSILIRLLFRLKLTFFSAEVRDSMRRLVP